MCTFAFVNIIHYSVCGLFGVRVSCLSRFRAAELQNGVSNPVSAQPKKKTIKSVPRAKENAKL